MSRSRSPRFQWIVSAENNHYLAWQSMLFHYSCRTYQRATPTIVVHQQGEPLVRGFERICEIGGRIQTAPNYRVTHGLEYPPRNTAGTLQCVESDADFLVLCDPDLIFLRRLTWSKFALPRRAVSLDYVAYLYPDAANFQPSLDRVCRRARVAPEQLRVTPLSGGVPHVIPRRLQQPLAAEWLQMIDHFAADAQAHGAGRIEPLASMWGLVLALHRLQYKAQLTNWSIANLPGQQQTIPSGRGTKPYLLHYCYGDARFDKRKFCDRVGAERRVWRLPRDRFDQYDTPSSAIRRQLHEARVFYFERAG